MASVAPHSLLPRSAAAAALRDVEHEAHTLAAITCALTEIPFYAKSPKPRAIPSPSLPFDVALRSLPLLFKADLRTSLPRQWVPAGRDVKAELASGEIEFVETSGSTAERTRILWDKGWWLRQEERAFCTNPLVERALHDGDRPYREAILTTPVCGLGSCHTGDLPLAERTDAHRLFLNMRPDPTFWKADDMGRMLDELTGHRTVGLESDPMYLAVLATYASQMGRRIDVESFVVLTYAFTSAAHVRAIRGGYDGPLLQLYGASEVGVLFMEGEDGLLHHCPLTTHVELLPIRVPTPGAKNVALVVVTTLDRVVQPLLRFVVGDLVEVETNAASRFTTVPPLRRIEGRLHDAVLRPDGAIVTAGAIDRALSPLEAIRFYQVNQTTPGEVEVDVVSESDQGDSVARALSGLFAGLVVSVRSVAAIAGEASGKFRLVRRHFPLDLDGLFEGCAGVRM